MSGRIARLAGARDIARIHLSQAIGSCPQDLRSSRELAALLLSDGRFSQAKTLYSSVIAGDGAGVREWYDYGVACAYDRDDERAVDAFDRVLADDPDHARALDLRFRILRTMALERGRAVV
ncbi:MAG TPA: hypothetical protein PK765_00365 [bacterium]|nr:hypothetical protein [bacterium]